MKKSLHLTFEEFFEKPTKKKLQELLLGHGGEYDQLDFKGEWPEFPKLAKHFLAMANSGGGVIVVGVAQGDKNQLEPIGLGDIKDKSVIHKGITKYLPKTLEYEIVDFKLENAPETDLKNKLFQVVLVENKPEFMPFTCENDGTGIRKSAIYTRSGTTSEEATYEQLQKIINARIETAYSTTKALEIEEHLDQLKGLYSRVPKNISVFGESIQLFMNPSMQPNPDYPKEGFNCFIARLIVEKKKVILELIKHL